MRDIEGLNGMEAMNRNPQIPQRLPDLSLEMRRFLAGVRDDEIGNLRLLAELRDDERKVLSFLLDNFTADDLKVISESLESLRSMRRFGRFGMWLMGFIVAGASAAAAVKVFFVSGGGK